MLRRAGSVVVAVSALVVAVATAHAGERGGIPDVEANEADYEVVASVRYTGDAAPGGGGIHSVSVPALCYWGPFNRLDSGGPPVGDGSDMQAVLEYIEWGWQQPHGNGYGWVQAYGDREKFEEAAENPDPNKQWFSPYCRIPTTDERAVEFAGGSAYYGMAVQAQLFTVADPPPPLIDPEDLAREARDVMVIDQPQVARNPEVTNLGGATLVNFPTWFWVTNPESVGGGDGVRSIRADVVGTPVFAEVTAETGGLSLSAPGADTFCPPETALTSWVPGATGGCVVQFPRASVGFPAGFPVSTSTVWNATWQGQTQDGEAVGGPLDPLNRGTQVDVPVAEVQTVVW